MSYMAFLGPLGLQGRHTWNSTFVLNDLETNLPIVKLDRIGGLFSLPELEDKRDLVIGGNGEVTYPSYTKGKTVTYEGHIIARDGQGLYAHRWTMLLAFQDQSNEGTMTITAHPDWGPGAWQFNARVMALDIDDEIIATSMDELPTPYKLHFILSLRMRNNNITQV